MLYCRPPILRMSQVGLQIKNVSAAYCQNGDAARDCDGRMVVFLVRMGCILLKFELGHCWGRQSKLSTDFSRTCLKSSVIIIRDGFSFL